MRGHLFRLRARLSAKGKAGGERRGRQQKAPNGRERSFTGAKGKIFEGRDMLNLIETWSEELAFVREFVVPRRVERYIFFLEHNRRKDFLNELSTHVFNYLCPEKCQVFRPKDIESVKLEIKKYYSGTDCYPINTEYDGGDRVAYLPILEGPWLFSYDAILSFVPGKLALYVVDDISSIFLCKAPSIKELDKIESEKRRQI